MKKFKESVFLTAKTTAMIMWLFIGSWTFASVFSYLGGHEVFEHFFKSMNIQPWQFLVITQIIIFLLGWPLEWTEILIIFVVGVILIGPEKLPEVLKYIFVTVKKIKDQFNDAKEEVSKTLNLEEALLDEKNKEILEDLKER